ncbi:site-specific recombinase XerD [Roseateles asaccharophilus]|uniref:tyrosine-type recombinase/integrase n=1 Tax=Roseateles asaccharophilus TaxID=582607 RepID=UPI00383776F3
MRDNDLQRLCRDASALDIPPASRRGSRLSPKGSALSERSSGSSETAGRAGGKVAREGSTGVLYVHKLGRQHFAYLRSIGEGLDMHEAASRYLGVEHGHSTLAAHRQVVDKLRGLCRRGGKKDWRLIGLAIRSGTVSEAPPLEEWAEANNLSDWRYEELLPMYQEAFPPDRKEKRNARLRERQIALLKELESQAEQKPQPTDLISGWFDDVTSARLKQSGMLMVGELQAAIARGGRWWSSIPAIGQGKADRIEKYLVTLCGELPKPQGVQRMAEIARSLASSAPMQAINATPTALPSPTLPALPARQPSADLADLEGRWGPNRATPVPSGTSASNDKEAIEAWVRARAGSELTAKSYRREAQRLLFWCETERKKALSSMNVEDCLAYMAFLQFIPPAFISRRGAPRFDIEQGWRPFAGQLSHDSQRQAIVICAAFFAWAVSASYLVANPWVLVNRKTGDKPLELISSRAFTEGAWASVRGFLEAAPPSPTRSRTIFIMDFGEGTGLRAAEMLSTRLDAFQPLRSRWVLKVQGKGSKNRVIAVPSQAVAALNRYLQERKLRPLGEAPPETPLVASAVDDNQGVGYRALYESTKSWFRRAIMASNLEGIERTTAYKASLHWLRHTCGTRALERGVPLAMVQEQLGHKDPRQTMKYSKTQLEALLDGMDKAFKG